MQTKNQEIQEDKRKGSAIMHAVETASAFQLYSYRIISHEQFISRVEELIALYQSQTKALSNGELVTTEN